MPELNDPTFPPGLLRKLKARAQLLKPTLFVGKAGVSDEFLSSLETQLREKELVKLKFVAFKDQKKTLCPKLLKASGSLLVTRVGNVAVLYRKNDDAAQPGCADHSG